MKTGKDLRDLIEANERDLAPGSETIIYTEVANEFGAGMSELDDDADMTVAYDRYKEAYDNLIEWEAEGAEGSPF